MVVTVLASNYISESASWTGTDLACVLQLGGAHGHFLFAMLSK